MHGMHSTADLARVGLELAQSWSAPAAARAQRPNRIDSLGAVWPRGGPATVEAVGRIEGYPPRGQPQSTPWG